MIYEPEKQIKLFLKSSYFKTVFILETDTLSENIKNLKKACDISF